MLLLAVLPAVAGVRICLLERSGERILSGPLTLPAIEVGAVQPLKFRVYATGADPVRIERYTVSGVDFTVTNAPKLPILVMAGAYLDLDAEFRPNLPGSGSGSLIVNQQEVVIVTQALPAPSIRAENGAVLRAGDTFTFGDVELGSRTVRAFVVENPAGQRVTVTRLELVGSAYSAAVVGVPFFLEASESRRIEVTFEPRSEGRHGASLYLNSREFLLEGTGIMPPVSRPRVVVEGTPRCGQQSRVGVRLESPAGWAVDGVLRMAFDGPADPAVRLMMGDGRALAFRIPAGESAARFGTSEGIEFQAGTTAGRITFTAELRAYREELAIDLAPAPVEFDTVSAARASSSIEVRFVAFDNTRTASALAFTFYDTSGRMIGLGPVRVDAAQDFRRYYDAATAGGLFTLRAVFPVRGEVQKIGAVDVEVINIQGIARKNVKMAE
jgi:hypothetical protein